MNKDIEIKFAKPIGFCYGVRRAIKLAEKALEKFNPVYTLGSLAHNKQLIKYLENKGIKAVKSVEGIEPSAIVIRSHGTGFKTIKELKDSGWTVIDATCPHVKLVHKLANSLYKEGYKVVVAGDKKHPEVIGIVEDVDGEVIVIEEPEDIKELQKANFKKIGMVSQTTQTVQHFESVINALLTRTFEMKIYNTICPATLKRQKATLELAGEVDMMIVVGSRESANTTKLVSLCEQQNTPVLLIDSPDQLNEVDFDNIRKLGITAGASTPNWLIEDVIKSINICIQT